MITLFVEDQQRSKEFYERVFDVAAANEDEGSVIFKFELVTHVLRSEVVNLGVRQR